MKEIQAIQIKINKNEPINLTEYVLYLQSLYKFEDKKKSSLKKKIERVIKENNDWDTAPLMNYKKTTAKVFSFDYCQQCLHNIKDYFAKKILEIDIEELNKTMETSQNLKEYYDGIDISDPYWRKRNNEKQEELQDYLDYYQKNVAVTSMEKLEVMISTLFYKQFNLDIKAWEQDKATVKNSTTSLETDPTGMLLEKAIQRLSSPMRSYVSEKSPWKAED